MSSGNKKESAALPERMRIHVQLGALVTLRTPAIARYYLHAESMEDVKRGLAFAQAQALDLLILGGGSNLVLTGDFNGLVLQVALKGIVTESFGEDGMVVTAAAGENWHRLVCAMVDQDYRGIENLALIPGTVGAAPVQNIGAYGVELKDVLESVQVLDRETLEVRNLTNAECRFAYRESLFKSPEGHQYIILAVTLKLHKQRPLRLDYGDIRQYLNVDPAEASVRQVMEAVIRIRQEKLPDPTLIPNAGSFFKNPIVGCRQYESLREQFPQLVSYPMADGTYKLAAGWLIDQLGWKGVRKGAVGVHERQALVLVNPGKGPGLQVLELAGEIQQSVRQRFGVELQIEPVIV